MLPTTIAQRDPSLTEIVLEYKPKELVGDSVGPILESDNRAIEYSILDKLNMFQDVDHRFARDGEANDVGATGTTAIVKMANRALKATISREDIEDSAKFFDVAALQVDVLKHTLALQREKEQANLLYNTLNAAGRVADPGNWGDLTGSAPDIFGYVQDLQAAAWVPYDMAIIPFQVLNKLRRAPSLLSQFYTGNTGKKSISIDDLKEMFNVSEIIVPEARISTSRRPQAVPDLSALPYVWGNHVIFGRKAQGQPSRQLPGLYYQWRRRWIKGEVGQNQQVRTWELPNKGIGGSYVVQQEYQVFHHVFPEMGFLCKDVLT